MEFLKSKRMVILFAIIALWATYFLGAIFIKFDVFFFMKLPSGFSTLYDVYFWPSFTSLAAIDSIFNGIFETIVLSITATMFGAILALAFAFSTLSRAKHNPIKKFATISASVSRNIPPYIWGLLLIYFLWYGSFVAIIALAIATYGFLLRAFMEVIETSSKDTIEALRSTGANNIQIIFKAVIPETLPLIVSWTLYAFELNIRGATIVALVTRFGLGGLLQDAIELEFIGTPEKYNIQLAIIMAISFVVILVNVAVVQIRKRLLSWN